MAQAFNYILQVQKNSHSHIQAWWPWSSLNSVIREPCTRHANLLLVQPHTFCFWELTHKGNFSTLFLFHLYIQCKPYSFLFFQFIVQAVSIFGLIMSTEKNKKGWNSKLVYWGSTGKCTQCWPNGSNSGMEMCYIWVEMKVETWTYWSTSHWESKEYSGGT